MNMWAEEGTPTTLDQMGQPVPTASIVIGSIRLAVRVSYIIQSIIDLSPVILFSIWNSKKCLLRFYRSWGLYDTCGNLRLGWVSNFNTFLVSTKMCSSH